MPSGAADQLRHAVDLCYQQEYESAGTVCGAMIREQPCDPAGYYWLAALVQMLIYDSGNPMLVDSFYRLCDSTQVLCRRRLQEMPGDKRLGLPFVSSALQPGDGLRAAWLGLVD